MSWGLMANQAWDFPADSLGYITGFAAELNEPLWTWRYGFFQMPRNSNGTALDQHFLQAWGMIAELERRFAVATHPVALRLLTYLNQAQMGSYGDAVFNPTRPAEFSATRAFLKKYGVGLNLEQELLRDVGVFSRAG